MKSFLDNLTPLRDGFYIDRMGIQWTSRFDYLYLCVLDLRYSYYPECILKHFYGVLRQIKDGVDDDHDGATTFLKLWLEEKDFLIDEKRVEYCYLNNRGEILLKDLETVLAEEEEK